MTSIELRPITPGDEELLYRVYASTRTEELAPVPWGEEQKEAFLRMQFSAQHRYYQAQFPRAQYSVLLLDGRPIGRLYVDRRADELRLLDIALLPEYRGAGLGGAMIRDLLAEAAGARLPVRIHVERFNRALGLYRRLGFNQVGDTGVYYLMEWLPPPAST